jgi:hypothetical protein
MDRTILLINYNLLFLLFLGLGVLSAVDGLQALCATFIVEFLVRYFITLYKLIHEQPDEIVRRFLIPVIWIF